jgi:hypothetical protein
MMIYMSKSTCMLRVGGWGEGFDCIDHRKTILVWFSDGADLMTVHERRLTSFIYSLSLPFFLSFIFFLNNTQMQG